jgi:uncharacterized membrane protein HdeD (DUF308 family)
MEQSQYTNYVQPQPYQHETRPKAPILVIIIAWLMLLYGIGSLLFILPTLLIGSVVIGGIALVRSIGLIAVSFGMKHMRRWALYTFTALTILAIGSSFYSFMKNPSGNLTDFADVVIQILVLVYLLAISKRFI